MNIKIDTKWKKMWLLIASTFSHPLTLIMAYALEVHFDLVDNVGNHIIFIHLMPLVIWLPIIHFLRFKIYAKFYPNQMDKFYQLSIYTLPGFFALAILVMPIDVYEFNHKFEPFIFVYGLVLEAMIISKLNRAKFRAK